MAAAGRASRAWTGRPRASARRRSWRRCRGSRTRFGIPAVGTMPRDAHQGAEALIHLRVPAAVKGRWIRASRAAGMRLTDWIVRAVETRMEQQIALITIPEDVSFADLQYQREPDGSVSFRWEPIERICEASGLDARIFRDAPEDVVAGL